MLPESSKETQRAGYELQSNSKAFAAEVKIGGMNGV